MFVLRPTTPRIGWSGLIALAMLACATDARPSDVTPAPSSDPPPSAPTPAVEPEPLTVVDIDAIEPEPEPEPEPTPTEPEPAPPAEPEPAPAELEADPDPASDTDAVIRVRVNFVAGKFYVAQVRVAGRKLQVDGDKATFLPVGTHTVMIRSMQDKSWSRAGTIELEEGHRYEVTLIPPASLRMRG